METTWRFKSSLADQSFLVEVFLGTIYRLKKEVFIEKKGKKLLDPKKVHKKLQLASDLFEFAFKVKSFQLRQKYPELSEKEIHQKTYALIERGCS